MKRIVLVLSVLLGCVNLVNAQIDTKPEKYGFKVWRGMDVPKFKVKMSDGKTIDIKKLRGKVVLLDFVGTQCGPCILGLKKFKKDIFERFKGKDLVVIPIVVKYKDVEDIKKFKERYEFDFPMGMDENKKITSLFYSHGGIPRYFLIDRKGKIVYHGPDYMPGAWDKMIQAIEETLNKK